MSESYQDKLFNYVGALIYEPQSAQLCCDDFPPEYQRLVEGIMLLGKFLREERTLAEALAHGQLKDLPDLSHDNNLAAPLKNLLSILRHITWQTQQVARGDYSQHLDFMDDFSDAFNMMVEQLKDRETRIQQEAETAKQAAIALRQSQALLMNLAFDLRRAIVVLAEDGTRLFASPSAQDFEQHSPLVAAQILQELHDYPSEHNQEVISWERSFITDPKSVPPEILYISVSSQPIIWEHQAAYAHILEDVTKDRENELEMRRLAYRDALTDVYNRRYGMALIADYESCHRQYCISFVDIDYLKHCNDAYGHEAGNEYILSVTHQLQKFGHESTLCRIGGDEFMLIAPDISEKEANKILAKLRADFEAIPLSWDTGEPENADAQAATIHLPHTFSYGSCTAGGPGGMLSSEAMSTADERMYKFKFAEKKRVAQSFGMTPEELVR